jgi:pantothenate kinase
LSLFNEVPASGSQANVNGATEKKKVHFVVTSCHTVGGIRTAFTKALSNVISVNQRSSAVKKLCGFCPVILQNHRTPRGFSLFLP